MPRHAVVPSEVGPVTLVAEGGALTGLYLVDQRHRPPEERFGERADAGEEPFAQASAQLDAYLAGRRSDFDLPLAFTGTAFQRVVWTALRDIPLGTTLTYGELAARIGRPGAARAVGLANGRNPIGIVVPCHRLVGADGGLTGYGGGLELKRRLLDHERRLAARLAET